MVPQDNAATVSPSTSNTSNNTDPTTTSAPKPKQRKLNRTLPQLKRNAACLPCRRRRIKCDAGKPHCSSCVRSYHFLARTQPDDSRDSKGVQCSYEDDGDDGEDDHGHPPQVNHSAPTESTISNNLPDLPRGTKRKEAGFNQDPKEVIKKLEQKVAELQQALAATNESSKQASAVSTSAIPSHHHTAVHQSNQLNPADTSTWSGPSPNQFPADFLNAPYIPPEVVSSSISDSFSALPYDGAFQGPMNFTNMASKSAPAITPQRDDPTRRSIQPPNTDDVDAEAGRFSGPFLDILFPGWPPKLPTPSMLDHLVETFFNMVPSVHRVLHRQSFLARLALPPTHSQFPHVALLHAICATAARYTAAVKCRPVPEAVEKTNQDAKRANGKGLPNDDPADETCFSERNARYALNAMKFEHVSGRGLLDMLQAMIVMGHWGQSSAKWIEGWITIGSGGRLAICLGLLDHQPDDFGMPALRQSILSPPVNDAEREERRAVMYYIMTYDCLSAASSGWPNTLPIAEMTTRMPCHRRDFDGLDYIPENPQNYHSKDLYTHHPVADGFNMMLKGITLLARSTQFIRRCRGLDPIDRVLVKQSTEFTDIDSDIASFHMHFPVSLRDPVQYLQGYAKGVDADLISAHLIPRVASIFLHEPFADWSDPSCPAVSRLLIEARAVLNVVYLVVSSNADISYMVMPICSCDYFFTAVRTLLSFFQRALESGDYGAAYTFRSEIAVFKMAFSAMTNRYAIGHRHLIMVEMLMKHAEMDTLGHPLPDGDTLPNVAHPQPPAWQVAYPTMARPYNPAENAVRLATDRNADRNAPSIVNDQSEGAIGQLNQTVGQREGNRRSVDNASFQSSPLDSSMGSTNEPVHGHGRNDPPGWVNWPGVPPGVTTTPYEHQNTLAQSLDPNFHLL
ncbi:uncharacterized protein IL334_007813 [Kwoniella shivajii]|uniref:Zn(2)-C6 fungal-type domain-containing protein n=1 Tax=Kwoniella shivajii TaxID=564305 RepID=A0ABZ1DBJ0_9TREE|nr:hypothetical protein IL334_007813 [Kwoniella shivajii]